MNKQNRIWIFASMLMISTSGWAQFAKSPNVIRDKRIDKLVDKQIELNQQALRGRTQLEPGFRIVVISTSSRDKATEVKAQLMKSYPEQKSYLLFQSPYFKVQFGNYKTYAEADAMKKELQLVYSDALMITPAQIEVRYEKEGLENQ